MLTDASKNLIRNTIETKTGLSHWSIQGPEIESRECFIYKATSLDNELVIAVKAYRDPKINDFILQHDVLKSFGETLNQKNEGYFVPKVYGSFPEEGIFLMEWIDSPALYQRLWRYCYSRHQVQSDISRTFKWLREFHQCAELEKKVANVSIYENSIAKCINKHSLSIDLKNTIEFKQGKTCFEECLKTYHNFSTMHGYLHGDFTPTNVLIDNEKVTGIDLFGSQFLPVDNDIALQFSYIAIEYPNMLTRYDFKLPPEDWPLLRVILDAYDYPNDKKQLGFFLFVFLYQLLRRWIIIDHRYHNSGKSLLDLWRLKNTKMIVKHLSESLKKIKN